MDICTYESLSIRIIRMLIHSIDDEFNYLYIKNFLEQKSNAYILSLVAAFKKFHIDFAKEKVHDLVCELGYDLYLKSIKKITPMYLLTFCESCGAAVIDKIHINVKPHVCWDKVDLEKFQFRYECIALLLEQKKITIEEAKFLVWSIEENGTFKLNFKKFF